MGVGLPAELESLDFRSPTRLLVNAPIVFVKAPLAFLLVLDSALPDDVFALDDIVKDGLEI